MGGEQSEATRVDRRGVLAGLGAALGGFVAGCAEQSDRSSDEQTATPTRTPTPSPEPHERLDGEVLQAVYVSIERNGSREVADQYLDAVLDAADETVQRFERLLHVLDSRAEFATVHRDGAGLALTHGNRGLDPSYVEDLRRVLNSEHALRDFVLQQGLDPTEQGYTILKGTESFGLNDTDGNGIVDGVQEFFLEFSVSLPDEFYDALRGLGQGGYAQVDIDTLDLLATYAQKNYESRFSRWQQARGASGDAPDVEGEDLVRRATEATSGEAVYSELQDADDDGLLDRTEEQFGLDPESEDSRGDGFTDMEMYALKHADEGILSQFDPVLHEKNVFVEVGSSDVAPSVDDEALALLGEFGRTDPVDEFPERDPSDVRTHFHFIAGTETGPDFRRFSEFKDNISDITLTHGLPTHFMYVVDDVITSAGEEVGGLARPGANAALLGGDHVDSFGAAKDASLLGHELGHSMGLVSEEIDGVDERVPPSEYDSMMNYTVAVGDIEFAKVDWEHLFETQFDNGELERTGIPV
jgi:hypothetical protein